MASTRGSNQHFMSEYHATMSKFVNPGRASRTSNPSTFKENANLSWSVPSHNSSNTAESHGAAMYDPVGIGKGFQGAVNPVRGLLEEHPYSNGNWNAPLHEYARTDASLGSQFGGDTWSQSSRAFDQTSMPGNGRGRGYGRGRGGYRGRHNSRGRGRQNRGRSHGNSNHTYTGSRQIRICTEEEEKEADPIQRLGILPVKFGQIEERVGELGTKLNTVSKDAKKGKFFSVDQVTKLHEAEGSVPNVPTYILQRRLLEDHAELASLAASGQSIASNGTEKLQRSAPTLPAQDDFVVKDPNNFEIPKLGSKEMPALTLKPLPPRQTLMQQINESLEPSLRDIPPPTYPFSKRKKDEPDLAAVGGIPNPAPPNLEPLPNPLEESAEQEAKCQEVAKEGYAESEFDDGLANSRFLIVGETVGDASRWKWFAGPSVSQVGNATDRELAFQLSGYDKGIEDNNAGPEAGDLWHEEKDKRVTIDRWVSRMTANNLKCPYILDVENEGFTSGCTPTSGLHFNYQIFPSDLSYRPVRLFYGAINWDVIPQPKLNEPAYMNGSKFNQTSQRAVSIELAKLERLLSEQKIHEVTRNTEMRRHRNSQLPLAPKLIDTSLALTKNNSWAPRVKMHVRVAKNSDVVGAQIIYNHYTKNSIDAPETMKVDYAAMTKRVTATRNEGYPFLVAVLRVDQGDPPARRVVKNRSSANVDGGAQEYIIGFARARSYNGIGTACFDDIALLEVFVSPQYARKRVGANLLDRLIGCLDVDYKSRQGVRIDVEPSRPKWTYNWRMTYAHVIKMYYHDVDERSFVGRKNFLEDDFGFTEFGAFPECCSKDGGKTRYNMAFLQRPANRLFTHPN